MRLAVDLPISEIKVQVVAYLAVGDVIVLQAPSLQLPTLIVLGTQIYGNRMFAGKVLRKLLVSEMLQEFCTSMSRPDDSGR